MAGKSRKPILLDEPVQWHLSTSKHDRCPWCGGDVAYLGARSRSYMGSCSASLSIDTSPKKWFEERMSGAPPTEFSDDFSRMLPVIDNVPKMALKAAQKDSLDKTARIPILVSPGTVAYILWKEGEYEPFDDPGTAWVKRKNKCCIKAGTPLWRALLRMNTWQPNDPKGVLDKLVDDDPAQLLRRKAVAAGR